MREAFHNPYKELAKRLDSVIGQAAPPVTLEERFDAEMTPWDLELLQQAKIKVSE